MESRSSSVKFLNLVATVWIFSLCLSFYRVIAFDAMCTSNHAGGIGCNFNRGMCGGIVAMNKRATWEIGSGAKEGPISRDWEPGDKGTVDGQYIYLKPGSAGEDNGFLYVPLSESIDAICVHFRIATTGQESHLVGVHFDNEGNMTLLDQVRVNTGGDWDDMSFPVCLTKTQQRNIMISVDAISSSSTVAIDYFEIVRSDISCPKETLSLQCACDCLEDNEGNDVYVSNTCSNDTSGTVECDFNDPSRPICTGMTILGEDDDGPVWSHNTDSTKVPVEIPQGDDVGYMLVRPSEKLNSDTSISAFVHTDVAAVCVSFDYASTGHKPISLRIYYLHDSLKTLIEELVVLTNGEWKPGKVSCCLASGSTKHIHFETRDVTGNSTLAIDNIKITRSTLPCPENKYVLPPTAEKKPEKKPEQEPKPEEPKPEEPKPEEPKPEKPKPNPKPESSPESDIKPAGGEPKPQSNPPKPQLPPAPVGGETGTQPKPEPKSEIPSEHNNPDGDSRGQSQVEPQGEVKPESSAVWKSVKGSDSTSSSDSSGSGGTNVAGIVVGTIVAVVVVALLIVGFVFRQQIMERFNTQFRYVQSKDESPSPPVTLPNPIYGSRADELEDDLQTQAVHLNNPLYSKSDSAA